MYCTNCGKEINDDSIRCIHCGNFVGAIKGNTTNNVSENLKESTPVFKFWSLHPLIIITVILWAIITILTWWYTCISFFIGYYMAKEWAPRINGSQSWAFAIGFFFGIFGLVGYWLYYRHKLENPGLQIPQQKKVGEELNHNNQYSKYWYNKGVELSESREYKKALDAYNQALDIDDKDPDIWNNMCYVLIKLGWYEQAINSGTVGVNLAPNDPVIWDTLRNAYLANNNPEKAAECSNKINNIKHRSAEKKSSSSDYGKSIGIGCGLFVFFLIVIAAISNWSSVAKSSSGVLYWIVFIILLIGILYEVWKAGTQ